MYLHEYDLQINTEMQELVQLYSMGSSNANVIESSISSPNSPNSNHYESNRLPRSIPVYGGHKQKTRKLSHKQCRNSNCRTQIRK